jgi:flavin reductase (DIM6/NTAB) family NADH-FMN oxidoreductase RutF
VVVITAAGSDGVRHGLVIGSFTSISLDPPLVGFFPDKRSSSWAKIAPVGRFCVNVLGSDQLDLCQRFAARAETSSPILPTITVPRGSPCSTMPSPGSIARSNA